MVPICQIKLKDLPYLPQSLKKISMIAFFFRADGFKSGNLNGQGWLLRTYQDLDSLIPLKMPTNIPSHSMWGHLKKYSLNFDIGEDEKKEPKFCSKLGGNPSWVQGEPTFRANLLFPEDTLVLDSKKFIKSDYFDIPIKKAPEIPMGEFWKARGWDKLPQHQKEEDYSYVFQLDCETFFEKTGWFLHSNQGVIYFFRGKGKAKDLWYCSIQFP